MCVGCRSRNEKKNLIRIVRTPEQEVVIDTTGKRAGRGAYLCPRVECLYKAAKSRALERALGVSIASEILSELENYFKKHQDGKENE
ncbi:MAG: uncharacterized protein PWP31_532 [Clostridia bacterium]|nr:uncharacterized protein [Clostridia bacterium]